MTIVSALPDRHVYRRRVAALLDRCGDGDERAFEALYRLTAPRLFGIATRLVHREALAEEVLQKAFLEIWRQAASRAGEPGAPLVWLTGVVRREALDTLRRRGVRENGPRPKREPLVDPLVDPLVGPFVGPFVDRAESFGAGAGDADVLRECLARLEPPVRDCIVRAYREGCSHHELSAAYGAPLRTVKSWTRRALIAIRSCVDELS